MAERKKKRTANDQVKVYCSIRPIEILHTIGPSSLESTPEVERVIRAHDRRFLREAGYLK